MKVKYLLLLVPIFVLQTNLLFSQNYYGIEFSAPNMIQRCQRCIEVFNQKPKEVKFSVKKDSIGNLFFEVTDKEWFNLLFINEFDGIALDIVSKEKYDCSIRYIEDTDIKGKLLKPVYTKELKEGLFAYDDTRFRVKIGTLLKEDLNKELEFNILFLNNNNLCNYYTIFDLDSYNWGLLDMGMFLDSVTYQTKLGKALDEQNYSLKYKNLKFIVPFKKNIAVYSQKDIKPLYDSLKLTDYNIKTINIRAYSSVEGSLERNIELQEQRANSIAKALQTFQEPTIVTEIFTSENWVEFLNDVSESNYAYLAELSKSQIKGKLRGNTAAKLEPILKNHRKAVITLQLEKKDRYKDKTSEELLYLFNTSIAEERIENAIEIQNSIFERLKNKEISPDYLSTMVIPRQIKYIDLLNKNAAFKYLMDDTNILSTYDELKSLEEMVPKNGKVKYNIAAIKFRIWQNNIQPIDENIFQLEIYDLRNYGIFPSFVDRMLVNFHLIKAELFMRKGDYENKDRSVKYIYDNYKKFPMTDFDYLSLAQYLTYFSNYDRAVRVLTKKVRSIDVDEDLLFYYLNLTLINDRLTRRPGYRTIMLNAINMNKERYCKIYNPLGQGGITFQLLDNVYLRKTYCENCN